MKSLKFLVFALLMPILSNAQTGWDFGLSLGISNYQGDLMKSTLPTFDQSNFAAALSAKNYITPMLAVRGNLAFSQLSGSDFNYPDDGFRRTRAVSFEAALTEFSVVAEYEPLGEKRFLASTGNTKVISPYAFAGIGLVVVDTELDVSKFNGGDALSQLLNNDLIADQGTVHVVMPIGVGLKMDVSKKMQMEVMPYHNY